jgi:hypothetical protein
MTDQRKPPGKTPPKALLDELNSIHSLLGDADRDVPPSSLLDDDVPLLEPASPASKSGSQPSLFDKTEASSRQPLNKALAERDNPFLPRKPAAPSSATPKIESTRPATTAPTPPGDARLRALVDETLAEWMPKIERDLRNRLMELLRNKS